MEYIYTFMVENDDGDERVFNVMETRAQSAWVYAVLNAGDTAQNIRLVSVKPATV